GFFEVSQDIVNLLRSALRCALAGELPGIDFADQEALAAARPVAGETFVRNFVVQPSTAPAHVVAALVDGHVALFAGLERWPALALPACASDHGDYVVADATNQILAFAGPRRDRGPVVFEVADLGKVFVPRVGRGREEIFEIERLGHEAITASPVRGCGVDC